jgi:hypothetical protein
LAAGDSATARKTVGWLSSVHVFRDSSAHEASILTTICCAATGIGGPMTPRRLSPPVAPNEHRGRNSLAKKQKFKYHLTSIEKLRALMPNESTSSSERARKRASGKKLREALIKRRETYCDLLVSGYSIE